MSETLCRLEEIDDPGAKGFTLTQEPREIFVVRQGRGVHAYINTCPHIGTPLEFRPDHFLTRDRSEILCSTHGARFEITTGHCTAGPCRGKSLTRVAVEIVNGWLKLAPAS
jgi:nitrite reductase/ring-hydroxylating ferredoxin subunit